MKHKKPTTTQLLVQSAWLIIAAAAIMLAQGCAKSDEPSEIPEITIELPASSSPADTAAAPPVDLQPLSTPEVGQLAPAADCTTDECANCPMNGQCKTPPDTESKNTPQTSPCSGGYCEPRGPLRRLFRR